MLERQGREKHLQEVGLERGAQEEERLRAADLERAHAEAQAEAEAKAVLAKKEEARKRKAARAKRRKERRRRVLAYVKDVLRNVSMHLLWVWALTTS